MRTTIGYTRAVVPTEDIPKDASSSCSIQGLAVDLYEFQWPCLFLPFLLQDPAPKNLSVQPVGVERIGNRPNPGILRNEFLIMKSLVHTFFVARRMFGVPLGIVETPFDVEERQEEGCLICPMELEATKSEGRVYR